MGWLETGEAFLMFSAENPGFGAVFTSGTRKGVGDSGMINKQICKTRVQSLGTLSRSEKLCAGGAQA